MSNSWDKVIALLKLFNERASKSVALLELANRKTAGAADQTRLAVKESRDCVRHIERLQKLSKKMRKAL